MLCWQNWRRHHSCYKSSSSRITASRFESFPTRKSRYDSRSGRIISSAWSVAKEIREVIHSPSPSPGLVGWHRRCENTRRTHLFPWKAVPFLEDATARVLLRRVGGGYSFAH